MQGYFPVGESELAELDKGSLLDAGGAKSSEGKSHDANVTRHIVFLCRSKEHPLARTSHFSHDHPSVDIGHSSDLQSGHA